MRTETPEPRGRGILQRMNLRISLGLALSEVEGWKEERRLRCVATHIPDTWLSPPLGGTESGLSVPRRRAERKRLLVFAFEPSKQNERSEYRAAKQRSRALFCILVYAPERGGHHDDIGQLCLCTGRDCTSTAGDGAPQ